MKVAERVRFELTVVLPTHAFQACALNHSAISPTSLISTGNRVTRFCRIDFLMLFVRTTVQQSPNQSGKTRPRSNLFATFRLASTSHAYGLKASSSDARLRPNVVSLTWGRWSGELTNVAARAVCVNLALFLSRPEMLRIMRTLSVRRISGPNEMVPPHAMTCQPP